MLLTSAYYNNRLQPCRISVNSSGTALSSCTASSVGNILDISYNFNPGTDNGNVISIANNIDSMRSQTFAYDTLNRLSTAQTNATYSTSSTKCWGEQYSYDPWGNLLGTGWPSSSYASCTQESPGPGGAVLANNQLSVDTYDAAGNITAMPNGSTYSYDAENHLLSTAGVNYTYDGDGNRVEKSNGTIYWHGGLDESNLSGSITNEYIFFGGARIARRDPSSNVFYYFSDHLGTARSIAEVPSGQTTATKCYDADLYPYGGERWYTDSCDSHFKFTGKERDSESGLDNFGARYNSSSMGRFMSPDWSTNPTPVPYASLPYPQSLNLYSYVQNNPLKSTDPTGHNPCTVDGETHGTVWCWAHRHGWVETKKETAAREKREAETREFLREHPEIVRQYQAAFVNVLTVGVLAGTDASGEDDDDSASVDTDAAGTAATDAAATEETPASTPVGRSGNPGDVAPGTNSPATINGRDYTGHALDQMQGRGIPPSVVEDTIQHGAPTAGNTPGEIVHYSSTNNMSVVTDAASGRVVTVHPGH